jgi:hypothetical protein
LLRGVGNRHYGEDVFVKICGITNEDDALLAVAMGADAVGFVFAPSPRQIAPSRVRDIVSRLPPEIVTIGVFVVLYRYRKNVFHLFRNALAATTAIALVVFSMYPLMPPRLLDSSCNSVDPTAWGGACYETDLFPGIVSDAPGLRPGELPRFGFVDTLDTVGGLWSFNSDAMQGISNQYAAMPSLHIGWAAWCAFALWPVLRRRWMKVAVMGYPLLTFLVIVATGNHFWLDAAGGLVTLAAGFALARWMQRWYDRRLRKRVEEFRAQHGLGAPASPTT